MNVPWSFIVFTYLVYPCSLVPCIDQTFIGSTDLVIGQAEKIVVFNIGSSSHGCFMFGTLHACFQNLN